MEIKKTHMVTDGYLGKTKVTLHNALDMYGHTYLHLTKRDAALPTLLGLPHHAEKERALSRTDIVEQLRDLRNERYR